MLGAFFCFLVVPLGLVDMGLHRMLNLRSEKEESAAYRQMDRSLEFLLRHSDDQHYFHAVFKRIFDRAVAAPDPEKSISESIALLGKRFGNSLKMIVWNSEGEKIERLSSEKRYSYIVKNLYQMFREVAIHCQSNFPGYPESLPLVSEKLNLFRGYLGRLLVANHLRLPFQPGIQGACILADTMDRMPLFWYHSAPELTFFCSVSGSLLNKNLGLKHALEVLNGTEKRFVAGMIEGENVFPRTDSDTEKEILFELGKYENASLPHLKTESNIYVFKLLGPNLRGFCRWPRKNLAASFPGGLESMYFSRFLIFLLISAYVFYCYSLRIRQMRFSIRLKLALIFIYINGLPLMILGTIGYEYLQQQRFNLISETHAANEKLLLEVDSGYWRFRDSMNAKVHRKLKKFKQDFMYVEPDMNLTELYDEFLEQLGAEEIHIFNRLGRILANHKKYKKPASQTFMKLFAAGSLLFVNQKTGDLFEQLVKQSKANVAVSGKVFIERGSSVLRNLLNKLERVEVFNFGTQMKLCYTTLLGNSAERNFHSLMIIVWREDEVQTTYAQQQIANFNRENEDGIFLAANVLNSGLLISPGIKSSKAVLPVLQKAASLQNYEEDSIDVDYKKYIATAIGGKSLTNLALVALSPADRVEKRIDSDKYILAIFVFVSMAISAGVALSLSKQFLEPVQQLSHAVININRRNFRYRTRIVSSDEFGDLGRVFNQSMEELEKLEIGRVVQENLLPGNKFSHGKVSIFAKTVSMTRMGGDYYDFFNIEDDLTGIFMGDVAGHGIPAALIMAMAKASVLVRVGERKDPGQLLTALHKMLFALKSDKFKRMMTCQYMTVAGDAGRLTVANAGHCFPVIVSHRGIESSYLEIIGSPVGISRRAKYQNVEVQLKPGDTLVLYSDGMLEANNAGQGAFGAGRFLKLTRVAWSQDLQQYYENMYNVYQNWAEAAEDDLTIVLVRYAGDGVCDD